MAVISVPKTPKSSFNPDRPMSGLLRSQVENLEAAIQSLGPSSLEPRRLKTERDATRYIQELHAYLQEKVEQSPPAQSPEPAAMARSLAAPPPAGRRAIANAAPAYAGASKARPSAPPPAWHAPKSSSAQVVTPSAARAESAVQPRKRKAAGKKKKAAVRTRAAGTRARRATAGPTRAKRRAR